MVEASALNQSTSNGKDAAEERAEFGARGDADSARQNLLDDAGFGPPKTFAKAEVPGADKSSYASKAEDSDKQKDGTVSDKTEKGDPVKEALNKYEEQMKELEIAGIKQFLIDADKAHRQHDKEAGKESDWAEFYTKMLSDKTGGMSDDEKKAMIDLFKAAGDAHGKFEEETGEEDKDWADWYARWIHERKAKGQPIR